MKKKQYLWLIAAAAVFAITGWLGVRSAENSRRSMAETSSTLMEQFSSFLPGSGDEDREMPSEPFLAQVNVDGTIADSADTAILGGSVGYDHAFTLDLIARLAEDPNNVGILLYVDSPGGTVNASDELYLALMDYKEATGRPIYCYFDDTACSGAYYAAMAADEICADRNSLCVNIGVYISTYNFSELFGKLGVEQVVFRSSENKGIGMQGVPWTDEQKEIYQSIVDIYYDQFVDIVAEGRGMTGEQVRALDDGREMLAIQALEKGFIDCIGREDNYRDRVMEETGAAVLYEETPDTDLFSSLMGYFSSVMPRSDAQVLEDFARTHSGMMVMAYDGNF